MTDFLDMDILDEFHSTFDDTKIFSHDEKFKYEWFNLFCAISHRITTCVDYLNQHSCYPATEEEFINFLTYSDMIIEGLRTILAKIDITNPFDDIDNDNSYKYFKDAIIDSPKNKKNKIHKIDNKIFKYIRALALAHSFGTNQQSSFLLKGEVQYSPFVLANNMGSFLSKVEYPVGLRVYSNKQEEQFDILFSFEKLKEFINSRYELLSLATKKLQEIICAQEIEWKKRKVNRDLPPIEILQDIQSILGERHEEDMVEDMIAYLTCELTNEDNQQSVDKFREALLNAIPQLCDNIDDMDYEKAHDTIEISHIRPKKLHKMCHYQMEKIFCYLSNENDESNIQWGLQQANAFAQEFAKKWVTIDIDSMSFDEIKLLVRTACYLEWLEQEGNK